MIFRKIAHLKMSRIPKNSKFRAGQMGNIAIFGATKSPILIFGQISQLRMSKVPKNSKFRAGQMANLGLQSNQN